MSGVTFGGVYDPVSNTGAGVTSAYVTAGGVSMNVGSDPHPDSDLLLEDGSYLLLEDGTSTILLE